METKRLSMNTSLKNARIFDEDSWESDNVGFMIKKEPNVDDVLNHNEEAKHSFKNIVVKQEPEEVKEFKKSALVEHDVQVEQNIEKEHDCSSEKIKTIKNECDQPDYEETGVKLDVTPMKQCFVNEDTNPSPFNKEMFKNFSLDSPGLKNSVFGPIKSEFEVDVKRSVFKSDSTSSDESQESEQETEEFQKRRPIRERLGPKVDDNEIPTKSSVKRRLGSELEHNTLPIKKPRREIESDPEVLFRRQKQIDYGKNTLGYDNYIKIIPRTERTQDDPQTPNKFVKYSRRGWDGLVKQWRLRLHKYDPEES
ncbi:unnamed protein product [Phaedon cochleariae]|uniref:Histone RNA hairpin-binding protein RNA-binding domain-containing protein n=1 Tax=Phaedon cochleariae TaxID=80249 RepID=A0A9P0GQI8_PHACE|nr:unnamed protein product [Phaedon cochleariae]